MTGTKKSPRTDKQVAPGAMAHRSALEIQATSVSPGEQVFGPLIERSIWVPFKLVPKENGKFDKIPTNGNRSLSTGKPTDWMTLAEAVAVVADARLDGVGLVLTNGIERADLTLVGFDFDKVDFEKFQLFCDGYLERSPSKTGCRAFAWVPISWAKRFKDCVVYPNHCDHCEVYFGTSSRFLTVTFDVVKEQAIPRLSQKELDLLKSWGLKPREAEKKLTNLPESMGKPIELKRFSLSTEQRHLVEGTGSIDRSNILYGLLIKLIDQGASTEDLLATIYHTPALWTYCLSHRNQDETKALRFAGEEISRAYAKSQTGMRQALICNKSKWQVVDPTQRKTIAYPQPYPGPMADTVAAALDVAFKPQPELTTMAVLSAMAASCGSFYKLPSGGRLNLYFVGIAPTGAGKDKPLKLARQLARVAMAKTIGTPASGQGLEDALTSNIATYCVVDEIAHFLSILNDARAPSYARANARLLLELFSASNDIFHGRELAGKQPRSVPYPAFNLLGFTTPVKMGSAFTPDDFADGLAGRILFVITDNNPPARRVSQTLEIPSSTENRAAMVARRLNYLLAEGTTIAVDEAADHLLNELLTEFDQQARDEESTWASALCVRSMEKLERIAGVLAAWDHPDNPTITAEKVEWAAQFVRASNDALLRYLERYMHHGKEWENAAKLLELLKDGKSKPQTPGEIAALQAGLVPRAVLMRRAKLELRDFDAALANLAERGEITMGRFGDKGMQVVGTSGDD